MSAGSLLEFALQEIPSFGVGRIRFIYMYPFSFDEFLLAQGYHGLLAEKERATVESPLPNVFHNQLKDQLRSFLLVGGMMKRKGSGVGIRTSNENFGQIGQVDIYPLYAIGNFIRKYT